MRLKEKEIKIIKDTIFKYFGKNVKIILFGSRVNDEKEGGDIDLYILPKNEENINYKRLLIKSKLKEKLFRPVDIIIGNKKMRKINIEAIKNGIELN